MSVRWFLVGPARSGSCVHIDPLSTSAWNTVLVGRKRWVLFPPDTQKKIGTLSDPNLVNNMQSAILSCFRSAKGVTVLLPGEDDEAVNYFTDLLPRIKKEHPDLNIIEFIQEPGQTVFVPGLSTFRLGRL